MYLIRPASSYVPKSVHSGSKSIARGRGGSAEKVSIFVLLFFLLSKNNDNIVEEKLSISIFFSKVYQC